MSHGDSTRGSLLSRDDCCVNPSFILGILLQAFIVGFICVQAGNVEQHDEDGEELPASSSASESAADSADADLEAGVAEWRHRGLPPAQSKAQRWGAPYHLQFAILFTR